MVKISSVFVFLLCLAIDCFGQCGVLNEFGVQPDFMYSNNNVYARVTDFHNSRDSAVVNQIITVFDRKGRPILNFDTIHQNDEQRVEVLSYNPSVEYFQSEVYIKSTSSHVHYDTKYYSVDSVKIVDLNGLGDPVTIWTDYPNKQVVIRNYRDQIFNKIFYDNSNCPDSIYASINMTAFTSIQPNSSSTNDQINYDTIRFEKEYRNGGLVKYKSVSNNPGSYTYFEYEVLENGLWEFKQNKTRDEGTRSFVYIYRNEQSKVDMFNETYADQLLLLKNNR